MDINKIGLIAIGSHEEKHGAVLPLDTDAKLASHVALEVAKSTGAKFLGVALASHEFPEIHTGNHQGLEPLMDELKQELKKAKKVLDIKAAIIVNGHGGNKPLRERVADIEKEVEIKLVFNDVLLKLEGPHAGTPEVSMGAAVGIADLSKLKEHSDFERYPEVGFVGMKEARRKYPWAEKQAREVIEHGVQANAELGRRLLKKAITDVRRDVIKLSRDF
jgi:2-amino-5-formylamino-6-ribosylaminopyrimidin-4(3H)-one 5'-monophosphate deformylase